MNVAISFIRLNKKLIFRFLVSGGVAAGVNVGILYFFTDWFGWWYLASAVLSFLAAVVTGFVLQKTWTFSHREGGKIHKQFMTYVAWTTISFFLNLLFLYCLVDVIGVYYLLSQLISSAVLAAGSLVIYSRLVFSV